MRTRTLVVALALTGLSSAALAAAAPTTPPVGLPVVEDEMPASAYVGTSPTKPLSFAGKLDALYPAGSGSIDFDKTLSTGDDFGNNTWGAGYEVGASISARSANLAGTDGDLLEADGYAKATATVFGKKKTIAYVVGELSSEYGEAIGGSVNVYVLGSNIYNHGVSHTLAFDKSWSRTFFSASQTYMVGPVPISVSASVSGELGFQLTGGLTTHGIQAEFEPFAGADVAASAGVGISGVASAGVTGELELVRISLPMTAELDVSQVVLSRRLTWGLSVDLVFEALAGKLKVYAELLWARYEKTIASWSGTSWTTSLYDNGGTFRY